MLAVYSVSSVAICSVLGITGLAILARPVPESLVMLAATALGGLVGMLPPVTQALGKNGSSRPLP